MCVKEKVASSMLGFQLKASMTFHEPSTPEMLSAAARLRQDQRDSGAFPEDGTTREEVKELTLNREDLEALKELAKQILEDLKK